ncbi:dual specificity protein phosphatase 4-like protein [Lates japonicus]|uniref:Dual specificity protein phosphatase 4-like protein n=1 Tax=Lates japonicus TaxID=270547 RepID=A0AAD3MKF6_LATJO|nr:dual specificity protein phosphatase 4-like protein [Lates japonicus]
MRGSHVVLKAGLLKDDMPCLLLDLPFFLAFSGRHICGAVNARCNTIVRRRAMGSVLRPTRYRQAEVGRLLLRDVPAGVVRREDAGLETVKEDSTVTLCSTRCAGTLRHTHIPAERRIYWCFSQNTQSLLKDQILTGPHQPVQHDSARSSCGTPHYPPGGSSRDPPSLSTLQRPRPPKKEVFGTP